MQKIKDLFQKDIYRTIEEVIKVDQADQQTVKSELEEYIATDSIKTHFREVLDAYLTAKQSPTEGVGVWISGSLVQANHLLQKYLVMLLQSRSTWWKSCRYLYRSGERQQNHQSIKTY